MTHTFTAKYIIGQLVQIKANRFACEYDDTPLTGQILAIRYEETDCGHDLRYLVLMANAEGIEGEIMLPQSSLEPISNDQFTSEE